MYHLSDHDWVKTQLKRWMTQAGLRLLDFPLASEQEIEAFFKQPYQPTAKRAVSWSIQSLGGGILIVTASEIETRAVMKAFEVGVTRARVHAGAKTYYGLGIYHGLPVSLVQSEPGTATAGGSLVTITHAIQDLKPRLIVMCGAAYGMRRDKQNIGDILVPRQLFSYDPKKVDDEHGEIPQGDRVTPSELPLDHFRSGLFDWKGPKVYFGLMLSGETDASSPEFAEKLLKIEKEAVGGDRVAAGLYTAARSANAAWILVKGIGWWGDGYNDIKTREANEEKAALNAAKYVRHVIKLGGWEEALQPRPEQPTEPTEKPRGEDQPTQSPHLFIVVSKKWHAQFGRATARTLGAECSLLLKRRSSVLLLIEDITFPDASSALCALRQVRLQNIDENASLLAGLARRMRAIFPPVKDDLFIQAFLEELIMEQEEKRKRTMQKEVSQRKYPLINDAEPNPIAAMYLSGMIDQLQTIQAELMAKNGGSFESDMEDPVFRESLREDVRRVTTEAKHIQDLVNLGLKVSSKSRYYLVFKNCLDDIFAADEDLLSNKLLMAKHTRDEKRALQVDLGELASTLGKITDHLDEIRSEQ